MPPVIAVAGKGGSGKTTLSALLVRSLLERQCTPVLAVDADPNTNFAEALGVTVEKTLGATVEEFHGARSQVPAGMTKEALLEMRFASIIEERKGFDVLSMGRGEGPGCYCSINNTLRLLVEKLVGSYRCAVIDNEAGLEHLSRRTSRRIDMLLMVSDFAVRGLRAALSVSSLVDELGLDVRHRLLVLCRAPADATERDQALPKLLEAVGPLPLELGGVVPHDEALVQADLSQSGLLAIGNDSPAVGAAMALTESILEKVGSC
jgi:CO dehydrogenase maturation factor